uniref:Major facilitator superfamily (MFS) profile domain-containing protein n=1 Tax=Arion vulgaris TaxID=1028688 RepID=A0A0B7AIZ6_9EUPU
MMSQETILMTHSPTVVSDYDTFANTKHQLPYNKVEDVIDSETFTVQQAIDKLGFGRYQIKMTMLAGLCYMADSMEIMMLSILSPAIKCTFNLSGTQEALLATAVFLGMGVMASAWGILSDKYGRRVTLLLFAVLTGYFGLLSALSPVYEWILVNRFLVGCGLAATPQSMTYYSEFLPKKSRATSVMTIALMWAAGSCLEVLLALLVIPSLGWRWLLAFSSVPLFIFAATYKLLPESPHYLVAHGQYQQAMESLKRVAASNGRDLPRGKLTGPDIQKIDSGRLRDLFLPPYFKTTVLVSLVWFSCNVSYYGTALLTTALFENDDGCHGYDSASATGQDNTCTSFCQSMTSSDYIDLLITTAGDVPGILLAILFLSKVGRKKVLCLLLLMYSVVMALCNICAPRMVLVVMLFVARAVINGAGQATYVYTAEVFPTCVRATGTGWCSAVARVGILATPFLAQVLIQKSAYIPISAYAVLGLVGAVAAISLPVETRDQDMKTTIDDKGT